MSQSQSQQTFTSDIINLNVGGTKFSTSRQTLCSVPDSFFSSLLSGRIPSCRDEHGFIFIDRDPKYFAIILNFLRTKELYINGVDDISVLRSEAEFYAITPLVKRLLLCEDLERSQCGDVLFTGFVPAPHVIARAANTVPAKSSASSIAMFETAASSSSAMMAAANSSSSSTASSSTSSSGQTLKPGNVLRLFPNPKPATGAEYTSYQSGVAGSSVGGSSHSRASSIDFQSVSAATAAAVISQHHQQQQQRLISHSRKSSNEYLASSSFSQNNPLTMNQPTSMVKCHSRNQSLELKQIKTDLGILLTDLGSGHASNASNTVTTSGHSSTTNNALVNGQLQVNLIVGHHNWISVAYAHYVCVYKLKDGMGWQLMFQSNFIEEEIERLAFNSKHQLSSSSNLLNSSNMMNLSSGMGPSVNSMNSSTSTTLSGSNSSNNSSNSSLPVGSNSNSIPMNLGNLMSLQSSSAAQQTAQTQQQQPQRTSDSFSAAQINPMTMAPTTPVLSTPSNQVIQATFSAANSTSPTQASDQSAKLCALIAISFKNTVRLWLVTDETSTHLIGQFSLGTCTIDQLFFIGSQLVATSLMGKIGVWNSLTQLWQTQDITPISSFDTAGSVLLLGGQNGYLYYIDMQKFPLRMKDNDLLVTQLYKDPCGDPITALSVYLTPKTSNTGNWIEIAYGTSTGQVRVIVQHPETVGHGPQLFQSFSVHRGSVIKVMLTEKHLVSVCSEFNHVRTWNVTRFRGMISTQPGSTPLASFKIVTIDAVDAPISYSAGNDIGPFGDRDNYQVFVQKCVPYTDQLFVRLSSTGKRLCAIKSIDFSTITSFCVHECEGPSRLNSRPRRYLFTGHSNGTIQVWDLTTALELKLSSVEMNSSSSSSSTSSTTSATISTYNRDLLMANGNSLGGPTPSEFAKLLDRIELASTTSGYSTPTTTNCFSPCSCIGGGGGGGGANNSGSGNGASSISSKYPNKNLLINTVGSLTNAAAGSHLSHMSVQHAGSIIHHHNQLADDEKNVLHTSSKVNSE